MNNQIEPHIEDKTEIKSAKGIRWLGLVGIAIGAVLLWIFMFKPLQDAQNQVAELVIVRKAALAGIVFTFFGLLVTIFGDGVLRMIPDMNSNLKDIPWYYWLTLVITAVLGVSLWFWFEGRLESLGYAI
jgi:HAMP domain-containing protein